MKDAGGRGYAWLVTSRAGGQIDLTRPRDVRDLLSRHGVWLAKAIGQHLLECWSRKQPAMRAAVHRPDSVVIRVEEVAELLIVVFVARDGRAQNKLLEEPRRVGEVPFRRARVRHGLNDEVLR